MLSDRQNKIEAKEKEEGEEQEQSEKSNQKISSSIYLNDMLPQTIEKRATEANVVKPKIIRRKMCVYTHKHTKICVWQECHAFKSPYIVLLNIADCMRLSERASERGRVMMSESPPCFCFFSLLDQLIKINSKNPLYFIRKWHIYPSNHL